MIIPDGVRHRYFGNLIGGHRRLPLCGPGVGQADIPRLCGAGGRVDFGGGAEYVDCWREWRLKPRGGRWCADPAFQKPHPRFGTSYRIINMIVGLQLLTIILTRGNVFTLAGLYAFGVIWSFAMMSLAVLVLRHKEPGGRVWKVPGNIHIGKRPRNPGGSHSRCGRPFHDGAGEPVDQTRSDNRRCRVQLRVFCDSLHIFRAPCCQTARRPAGEPGSVPGLWKSATSHGDAGCTSGKHAGRSARSQKPLLLAARSPAITNTTKQDVVVMSCPALSSRTQFQPGSAVFMRAAQVFDHYEQELFTAAVAVAEKEGKPISLLVVPATDVFEAIMVTAQRLDSSSGGSAGCRTSSRRTSRRNLPATHGSGCRSRVRD